MTLRTIWCAAVLGAVTAATLLSQTPPDLQQMRNQIQQLEKMVNDLKGQLAEVEKSEKIPGAPLTAPPKPAPGQVPTAQLPDYIGTETRLRDTAGQNEVGAPRLDNEPLDPELRGFFRIPGTSTLVKFGGFVKTDFFYDTNFAGTYYGGYVPSSFPSTPTPKSANSTVSMRPSRFSTEFRHGNLDGSPDNVKVYLEYDFLGNYDRTSLRMRQFYAQYKNFLGGQTWSAFGDPDAFPDTLEFEGPPGIVGLRSPQFRYTQPLGDHNRVGISVEKSGTDTPFSTQFGVPFGTSLWPDFIGFYRYENSHGHIHVAGVSRSVGGVIANTTVPDLTNHVPGYGGSISGTWGIGKQGRDNLVFQAIIGKGISNYYNDNFGLGSDVGFSASGKLVATPTGSGEVGYTHYWSKLVRSTFSYGYTRINNTARDPGTNYHVSNYATGGIIIQPSVRYLFGAEYIYGSLERKDGFKWIAPRIQATVTYYINKYPRE